MGGGPCCAEDKGRWRVEVEGERASDERYERSVLTVRTISTHWTLKADDGGLGQAIARLFMSRGHGSRVTGPGVRSQESGVRSQESGVR
eukprot:1600983-Rhodomonas_salina.1